MKNFFFLLFLITVISINAQYKDQPTELDVKGGIVNDYSSSLFGFFNLNNFKMSHTFDLSYQTSGFGNIALTTYTNSMIYKFNDQLNIQADISLVNSPYNSFDKNFAQNINGLYLSRAQINYKPTKDMTIMFQYRNIPATSYNPYSWYRYGSYYDPFYDYTTFEKER